MAVKVSEECVGDSSSGESPHVGSYSSPGWPFFTQKSHRKNPFKPKQGGRVLCRQRGPGKESGDPLAVLAWVSQFPSLGLSQMGMM